jgi:hypothetical protein
MQRIGSAYNAGEVRFPPPHQAKMDRDAIAAFLGAVLREIQRHVMEWERQQTPEQAEWMARFGRQSYLSTRAGAREIVKALRRRPSQLQAFDSRPPEGAPTGAPASFTRCSHDALTGFPRLQ